MEITLDTNLKLILKNLNLEQKGKLFDMLLEQSNDTTDEEVKNYYEYIENISIKKQTKKAKMKTLGLLGSSVRWKKSEEKDKNNNINSDANANANSDANTDANSVNSKKRKEAKENKNNNLNNINNFILNQSSLIDEKQHKYKIPTIDEVKQYIKANSFNVDAETFIDFYESRGWCVGKSKIKNWQATIRMWHKRSLSTSQSLPQKEDEQYWHELKEKYWTPQPKSPPPKFYNQKDATEDTLELSSHFARLMKRIEDNDLTP